MMQAMSWAIFLTIYTEEIDNDYLIYTRIY